MQEDFLDYVWKSQCFDKKDLATCKGEALTIFSGGTHNGHAGPDFLNGHIAINKVIWHGHIELHVNASDWYVHNHQDDRAYDNVMLHVVWHYDKDILHQDGTIMPTLSLRDRVAPQLQQRYQRLVQNKATIPCAKHLPQVPDFVRTSMLDKALFQRLTHKHSLVNRLLADNKGSWEETAYQLLAHNFGFKVNSDPFLDLARSLPLKVIIKHADNLQQVEALLFGQAGLLGIAPEEKDDYLEGLKKEYKYLAHKYQLKTDSIHESQWKFFRLRPANFPTIRLAQFCQLLHQSSNVFSLLTDTPIKALYENLAVTQSAYWQEHYQFGTESKTKIGGLGRESVGHILINAVVPLLVAYGKAKDEQGCVERAVAILEDLPAEDNVILRHWEEVGIKVKSAFDSQALIELFNNFCSPKKCLSCNIGASILREERSKVQ